MEGVVQEVFRGRTRQAGTWLARSWAENQVCSSVSYAGSVLLPLLLPVLTFPCVLLQRRARMTQRCCRGICSLRLLHAINCACSSFIKQRNMLLLGLLCVVLRCP